MGYRITPHGGHAVQVLSGPNNGYLFSVLEGGVLSETMTQKAWAGGRWEKLEVEPMGDVPNPTYDVWLVPNPTGPQDVVRTRGMTVFRVEHGAACFYQGTSLVLAFGVGFWYSVRQHRAERSSGDRA